jgi:low affinity Fe/Cu permease
MDSIKKIWPAIIAILLILVIVLLSVNDNISGFWTNLLISIGAGLAVFLTTELVEFVFRNERTEIQNKLTSLQEKMEESMKYIIQLEERAKNKLTSLQEKMEESGKNIIQLEERSRKKLTSLQEMMEESGKYTIILEDRARKNLENKGYYDSLYNNNDNIKICGRALSSVINVICSTKQKKNSWVSQLKERREVSVKILLMNPESQAVENLKAHEPNIRTKISALISKLDSFSKISDTNLAEDSYIQIRVSNQPISYTITYAGKGEYPTEATLLIGFMFLHDNGPIYTVKHPDKSNTHNECMNYFESIFEEAKEVFSWSSFGKTFTPIQG